MNPTSHTVQNFREYIRQRLEQGQQIQRIRQQQRMVNQITQQRRRVEQMQENKRKQEEVKIRQSERQIQIENGKKQTQSKEKSIQPNDRLEDQSQPNFKSVLGYFFLLLILLWLIIIAITTYQYGETIDVDMMWLLKDHPHQFGSKTKYNY